MSASKKLRVFVVHGSHHLTDHEFSGDGLVAWGFISHLAARGHEVVVATDYLNVKGPIPANLTLVHIAQKHRNKLLHYISYMRQARLLLKKVHASEKIDVAHQMNPVVRGLSLALVGSRVPLVLGTYVGDWTPLPASPHYNKPSIQRRFSVSAKVIIDAVQQLFAARLMLATPYALQRVPLSKRLSSRIDFLHHGVDTKLFSPVRAEGDPPLVSRRVLYVGSIQYHKGITVLVDAFARLLHDISDAELVIVGDGRLLDSVKRQVADLGVADRVVFLGRQSREEVAGWMRSCEVLCAPSFCEPYGQNILEAMASGKPVVLSTEGGHRYLGDDRGTISVAPGNVSDLTAALARILASPALAVSMGRHNREVVEERNAWPIVAEKLEQIYLHAIEVHKRPSRFSPL